MSEGVRADANSAGLGASGSDGRGGFGGRQTRDKAENKQFVFVPVAIFNLRDYFYSVDLFYLKQNSLTA